MQTAIRRSRSVRPRSLAVATVLLFAAAPAHADELRLLDGRVIVGKVAEQGANYEVTTHNGTVVVPIAQVEKRTTEAELRRQFAEQARHADDTTFAHLQLAVQARATGLEPELWRHLDLALARRDQVDPEAAPGLQRRLEGFLAQLEPELLPRRHRTATTAVRVHQLLEARRPDNSAGREAAIEELLVREAQADQDLRLQARRNGSPLRRSTALKALQRRALAGNDRFVLRSAVLDADEAVRRTAAALSRPGLQRADLDYLATGLAHQNGKVRIRTAEALGELGHPDAVKLLVLAGPQAASGLAAGGDAGVRSHIAIVQQQAYIRDFDVEIASAAFIADPKIGLLQSGTVLDVTVFGVTEVRTIVRAYRKALEHLTHRDPGENPAAWGVWYSQLPAAAASPAPTTPARAR
jgi:hypothetical protein